jgi:hypothetical protein
LYIEASFSVVRFRIVHIVRGVSSGDSTRRQIYEYAAAKRALLHKRYVTFRLV